MRKNRIWSYEEKVLIIKERKSGVTLKSLQEKYKIKSAGMIVNWVRDYDNNCLSIYQQGKPKHQASEYEILKKCYAQLMKIRSK